MLRVDDRIKATSSSVGVGDFVLDGAGTGGRNFAGVVAVGDTFGYSIDDANSTNWETGIGTYSAANTITRTKVLASSNAGALVNFAAGPKTVQLTLASDELANSIRMPLTFPKVTFAAFTALSHSGWSATASSGTPSAGIDGNTGTRWTLGSPPTVNVSFYQIDTAAVQPLGGLQLNQTASPGDVPVSGKVQLSSDGVAFHDVATWTTAANFTANKLTVGWVPENARFVKLIATGLSNGASSNWWSIDEADLSATTPVAPVGPVENVALETITGKPNWQLRVRGIFRKGVTPDDIEFKVGVDLNNCYSFRFQGGTIKTTKIVAGAGSDIGANLLFANDTAPHTIDFTIAIADAVGGADLLNWFQTTVTQANATINTVTSTDNALDFRSGVKKFWLKTTDTSQVRGLNFSYGPAIV